jgi:amino acid permease
MQFTAQEMKLIERLRKQERRWPRTRWILLVMAAFGLAIYGYVAYFLFSTLDAQTFSPADSALLFAVLWPKALLMAVIAGAFIALAVRDWRGNVHRMLLLRLLDAHQKETNRDENVG